MISRISLLFLILELLRQTSAQGAPLVPRLFSVVQNNHQEVVVEIGNFAKFYNLPSDIYQVAVIHEEQKILVSDIKTTKATLRFPIKRSGVYEFYFYQQNEKIFWRQQVFAVASQDVSVTEAETRRLAEAFAPVISYDEGEKYYPTSLDYIFNLVDTDSELQKEPFRLTNLAPSRVILKVPLWGLGQGISVDLSFKELPSILPFMGSTDSVLKSGLLDFAMSRLRNRTGEKHPQVYYSLIEDPSKNQIALIYHFFYTYDSKTGNENEDSWGDHLFDRESMSVILNRETREPLFVIYNSHIADQEVAFLNRQLNVVQSWTQGRVYVEWAEAPKAGGHPAAFAALGSHALYPARGFYAVLYFGQLKALVESAGGLRYLAPTSISKSVYMPLGSGGVRSSYKLAPLKLDTLTSTATDVTSILSYSGSMVDVLGGKNAAFPPFVSDGSFLQHLDVQNAFKFNMKKAYEVGF